MLKLSRSYCCENRRAHHGCREKAEAVWLKAFGDAEWASVAEVVRAYARYLPSWRDTAYPLRLLRAVFRDLPDKEAAKVYNKTNLRCPKTRQQRALDRRTAKAIDAEWEGTLDYC